MAIQQNFNVNTTTAGIQLDSSVTTLADGRFVVTWGSFTNGVPDSDYVGARVFNIDGSAGNDFVVNTTPFNSSQPRPVVTALADGRFVVTWRGDLTTRARLFDADGSPVSNDFVLGPEGISGETLSYQALLDGRYMVTREDQSGYLYLYGHIFNADGTPASSEFLVAVENNLFGPVVTALADGRFVVVWTTSDLPNWDNVGTTIRARIFNADGSAVGDDFVVYPTTLPYPMVARLRVTPLPDGSFVVTWDAESGLGEDSPDIRGQIYDPQLTVLIGKTTADTWQGGSFDDRITGRSGSDTLSGNGGDDLISGDAGHDILNGGAGNDKLFGGAGTDTLDGGTGNDIMAGNAANDTYRVNAAGDRVFETPGDGVDTVFTSVSFSLAVGAEVEILRTTGDAATTAINLAGNAFANSLIGNAGANVLNGRAGADKMWGLGGNDTYVVDHAADAVFEGANLGTDRVSSTVSFTLGANLENLTLIGSTAIDGTGNGLGNVIVGNGSKNDLNGGGGNDVLIGNLGRDTSTGGGGNDIFRFLATTHSPVGGAFADVIADFDGIGNDLLDLSALFGPAMTYRHNLPFTAAGQVRITDVAGPDVIVEVNTGGTLAADMQVRLSNTTLASMTASDILL